MTRPRFSLRGLLTGTALVALGCGALVSATEFVGNLAFGATLVALVVATVGAAVRRGRGQAFWLGFAIVGWAYVVLVHAPIGEHDANRNDATWHIRPEGPILTTRLLVWFYDHWLNPFEPASQPPAKSQSGGFFGDATQRAMRRQDLHAMLDERMDQVSSKSDLVPGGGGPADAVLLAQIGGGFGRGTAGGAAPAPAARFRNGPLLHDFLRVGQSIFTLLFAFCGALLGSWFYQSNEPTTGGQQVA